MILDVGCGLKREGDVNIDINPDVKPDVLSDFRFLPFRRGTFDVVSFNHSLEHVPDPPLALAESSRILKKGGILKVKFPNHFSIASLLEILERKSFWCVKRADHWFDCHWSFLFSPQMTLVFIQNGFIPIKFEPDRRYFKRHRIIKIVYMFFPFLCPDVTLYGKKTR